MMKTLLVSLALLANAVSDSNPKPEFYKERPFRAVTFVVSAKGQPTLKSISLSTIRNIYSCKWRNWKDVPGSGRTDDILAIGLWEQEEATKRLKKMIPGFTFGPCANVYSGPDTSRAVFYAIGTLMQNKMGIKGEALN